MKLNVESGLLRSSDVSETRQNSKQPWQGWINNVGSVDEAVSSASAEFKGKHVRNKQLKLEHTSFDLSYDLSTTSAQRGRRSLIVIMYSVQRSIQMFYFKSIL